MSGSFLGLPATIFPPPTTGPVAHWQALRAGAVDWTIESELREALLDDAGPRWAEWMHREAIEVIKTGPHRTVYRLQLAAGEFYLKHFRMADWRAWLRNTFRTSPAERELQAVLRIAALRLPTFEPVALGVSRHFGATGDTYLISRAIPKAEPLDHYLLTEFTSGAPAKRVALRQRLATELGRLAARLHAAGVEHVDLHAGNLLIRPDAGLNESLLSLIDLHAVRFRPSLSQSRRDRNLAALHHFFAQRSTRADRHRFWVAYQAELRSRALGITTRSAGEETLENHPRTSLPMTEGAPVCESVSNGKSIDPSSPSLTLRVGMVDRAHCARLERLLDQAAQAGWRRADRAWKRGNRHVRRLNSRNAHCRGLATLDADWLNALRDDPERPFEKFRVRWCKRSGRHRVAEVAIPIALSAPPRSTDCQSARAGIPGEAETRPAVWSETDSANPPSLHGYWKCVTDSRWAAALQSRWRFSAVRRAWETGHALLRRGIDTPRPILFVESSTGSEHRGYLLTEAVADSTTLADFFQRRWPALGDAERAAWLERHSRRLARQLRRLHESGFDHRDLKFPNLLVSTDDEDDRVWLLDLDAVRAWPALPTFRRIQNLARLCVSSLLVAEVRATDRLRFLRWYLGPVFADEWKEWWRRVDARSLRKIDRNHQVARPLS